MEIVKEIYKSSDYQDALRKRLPLLIEASNMGFNAFARHSRVCDKTVRAFLKDDGKVLSRLILKKFETNIKDLNPNWLWNGEGEMFLKEQQKVVEQKVNSGGNLLDMELVKKNINILLGMLEMTPFTFDKKVGLRIGTVSAFLKGNKEIAECDLDKMAENLRVVNPEWLKYGRGAMIINN